jgi:hypothetical protein
MPTAKTGETGGLNSLNSTGWRDNMSGKEMFGAMGTGLFRCAKTAHPNSFLSL